MTTADPTESMTAAASTRAWSWIDRPFVPWMVIALGVLLVVPSVSSGLGSDDYVIASQLREGHTIHGLSRGPADLFVFAPGDPAAARPLIEEGIFPWWADPAAKIAFFRPLASLSHALDHALFPGAPRVWHAHSVLWFFLALVAVGALYRRLFDSIAPATLALLLFALDDAHGPAVGWLAARNGLMALTFGAAALWAFVRWRKEGWRPGAALGPVFLALGLASSEAALAACAYHGTYALLVDEGRIGARLARLWGFAAVLVVWAVVYVSLGYGTSGTTHYIDPIREPALFLPELARRLPVLLVAQLFGPWSDLWPVYPSVSPALPGAVWAFALVALAGMTIVAWPLLRRDRLARFAAVGAVLALVPPCAGAPADRVLLFAGIGAMALTASLVTAFVRRRRETFPTPASRVIAAIAVALVALVHVVANLYWLPTRSLTNAFFAPVFERANDSFPRDSEIKDKSVVLVNPPFEPLSLYMAFTRDAAGDPRAAHVRVLSTGASATAITRVDDRTLRVRPDLGFLSSPADSMLRSPKRPLPIGAVASLSDVAIEITEHTRDGRPAEALFRFRVPLEHPSLVWRKWGERTYVPFDVPKVGETVRVDAVDFGRLFAPEAK
jgi:hypothetical protein